MPRVELRSLILVILAGLLYLCLEALRRLLARGSEVTERLATVHGASERDELSRELRVPQRLLAAYALLRALDLVLAGRANAGFVRGLGALAGFLGATGVLRLVVMLAYAARRRRGPDVPRILRSIVDFALYFLVAAAILRSSYDLDLSSLLATSAVLSVVLGFALQETLGNLFAGLTLHAEQPFGRGDAVSFSKYTGRVLDVGWRSTRIVTLDEDELIVPNSLLSREPVINHSRPVPLECIELLVKLDLDVSPARAKQVLLETVQRSPRTLSRPPPLVQLAWFEDSGAAYRVRFFIDDRLHERAARDEVQEALWYALRRAGIDMPYPQQTISVRERAAEADERRLKEHLSEAQDLLSRIDFVAALDEDSRRILAERARYLEYGPGQAVVRQGEQGDTFYLVAHGDLAVRVAIEGGEKEVAKLGRGAFFGEMSLLTGDPRTATVTAEGDAALLAIDREAFERVFAQHPATAQELAQVIARRRLALESAKAEAVPQAAVEKEASNLLARIRSIFRARN